MQTIGYAEKRVDITNIAGRVSGIYLVEVLQAASFTLQAELQYKIGTYRRIGM